MLLCEPVAVYFNLSKLLQLDSSHCKLEYEENGQAELDAFYDFSTAEEFVPLGDEDKQLIQANSGTPIVADDNMELVLPSGARLGHRSLARYYRQRLAPDEVICFSLCSSRYLCCLLISTSRPVIL